MLQSNLPSLLLVLANLAANQVAITLSAVYMRHLSAQSRRLSAPQISLASGVSAGTMHMAGKRHSNISCSICKADTHLHVLLSEVASMVMSIPETACTSNTNRRQQGAGFHNLNEKAASSGLQFL